MLENDVFVLKALYGECGVLNERCDEVGREKNDDVDDEEDEDDEEGRRRLREAFRFVLDLDERSLDGDEVNESSVSLLISLTCD